MPDQNTDHRSDRPDHGRAGRPGAPFGGGRREGGPQPDRDRRPQGDGDRRPQPDRDRRPNAGRPPRDGERRAPQDGRPPRGGERRGGRTFSDRDGRKPQGDRDRGRKPQGDRPPRDGERRNRPRREVKPAYKTAETEKRFDVSPARKAALQVGRFLRERDAFAQDLISKHIDASRMSREDRAFATRLVLGVVSARGTLDEIIDRSLRSPDDVQDDVRDALRIGVYEMYFLDKSPHAAVDQCVELVRTFAPKACGLANAVLRKASSLKDEFPFGNPQADLEAFARQYAFPVWLAKRLVADLGLDAASEFMEASNEPAPLFAAVNAARAADEEVRAELEAAHGDPQPVEIDGRTIPGCYRVSSGRVLQDGRIKRMLNQGKLFVSDAASQEVARLVLPATLPQSFLEIGAGRGTKTLLLQSGALRVYGRQMPGYVTVDNHDFKTRLLRERAEAFGIQVAETRTADATELDEAFPGRLFDVVFVDAPCSGLGTLRRHPEIRWRLNGDTIDKMADAGLALLKSAASHVAMGGTLAFATCTVTHVENNGVVMRFLESPEGASFALAPLEGKGCFATRLRSGSPDAHFAVKMVRTGDPGVESD